MVKTKIPLVEEHFMIPFLVLAFVPAMCIPSPEPKCECFLFLKDDLWSPEYQVMALTNNHPVDCTDFGRASEECKNYCTDEITVLNSLYQTDPSIFQNYPPAQSLPCLILPRATVSFSKVCGSQSYLLSSKESGPPVCCTNSTQKPIWCGSDRSKNTAYLESFSNEGEGRKIDLSKSPDEESQNEIDDTEPPKTKQTKNKIKISPISSENNTSWTQTILQFFGYKNLMDVIKNIDIFSFPSKIQAAMRTYRDEVSMGQCYMEFTTFKVFKKQESPFEGLLRKKREVHYSSDPVTRFDEDIGLYGYQGDVEDSTNTSNRAQVESIQKVVGGLSGILKRSENTKQYADVLTSFIPFLNNLMSTDGGAGAASPISTLLRLMGPILSQMGGSRPTNANNINVIHNQEVPLRPRPSPFGSQSPSSGAPQPALSSMVMKMLGTIVSNFFQPQANSNRIQPPAPVTRSPKPLTPAPPTFNSDSSGISNLMNLFLQSAVHNAPVARPIETPQSRPRPRPQTRPRPRPRPGSPIQAVDTSAIDENNEKDFIDLVLELIRPVFISILGTAPGESGVKAIRRASTLSTLGRVDDSVREEVDSPLFCFKKYVINKAWAITENGIRSFIGQFTPEEQTKMMRRLQA